MMEAESGRVLIADDEVHIRLLLEQTLEDLEDDGVENAKSNPHKY